MKYILKGLLIMISISAIQCFTSPEKSARSIPLVENLDIQKFTLNKWYEISRIPIPIGSDWVNTTSTYTIKKDSELSAMYEGFSETPTGKKKSLSGKAKLESNSLWQISYIPFLYSDFRIIKVSPDYQNAIVTSGTKDFLWILCKNPKMDEKIYTEYLEFSKQNGFDISKLEKVLQDWK